MTLPAAGFPTGWWVQVSRRSVGQFPVAEYGLERVAIIDLDVHHGNGTEAIFRRNPKVMVCSLFERSSLSDVWCHKFNAA